VVKSRRKYTICLVCSSTGKQDTQCQRSPFERHQRSVTFPCQPHEGKVKSGSGASPTATCDAVCLAAAAEVKNKILTPFAFCRSLWPSLQRVGIDTNEWPGL